MFAGKTGDDRNNRSGDLWLDLAADHQSTELIEKADVGADLSANVQSTYKYTGERF